MKQEPESLKRREEETDWKRNNGEVGKKEMIWQSGGEGKLEDKEEQV